LPAQIVAHHRNGDAGHRGERLRAELTMISFMRFMPSSLGITRFSVFSAKSPYFS
jgi:hypothetical protein